MYEVNYKDLQHLLNISRREARALIAIATREIIDVITLKHYASAIEVERYIRSSDERYDGKNEVLTCIEALQKDGISSSVKQEILRSRSCIRRRRMVGKFAIYAKFAKPADVEQMNRKLREVYDAMVESHQL